MVANDKDKTRRRLERLAWYLDNSIPIPGLNARIGIDPLLGLLPGIGDTIGALLSSYILAAAGRLGVPKTVLLKMAFNIAVEVVFGALPVLGDFFDMAWKANQRNVQLLDNYLDQPRKTVVANRLFVWTLGALLVGLVIFIGFLGFLLVRAVWLAVSGP
ncbi:MAG: DUF4112 domain-containing protein [Desulfuromonadales bacterium]|jgi:amino acid permease